MRFLLVALAVFGLSVQSFGKPLQSEISKINREISLSGKPIIAIQASDFLNWYREFAFQYGKKERRLDSFLEKMELPDDVSLKVDFNTSSIVVEGDIIQNVPEQPWVSPFPEVTVARGMKLASPYLELFKYDCKNSGEDRDLCSESYRGPLVRNRSGFPTNIPVRTSVIRVSGECMVPGSCEYESLEVEFLVDQTNIDRFINYFSKGFDLAKIELELRRSISGGPTWVKLDYIFPNWLAKKISTFAHADDNEVCHGPARQFYNEELFNGSHDRSTGATGMLLGLFYCRIQDSEEPDFGDYLYRTGVHSGRFILKDPKTSRWIGFSVQSGGYVPYRLWWVDEDFSLKPFGHQPDANFRSRVDIWSRCK